MSFSKAIRLHLDYSESETELSELNILQTPEGIFLFRDPNDLRPAFMIEGHGEDYLVGLLLFNEESEANDAIRNHIDDDVKIGVLQEQKKEQRKPFLIVSVPSKESPRQVDGYEDYVFIKKNKSKTLIHKDPPEIGAYFAVKASEDTQKVLDKTYFYYMLTMFESMLERYYLGTTVAGIRLNDVYDFINKAMEKAHQMRKQSKVKKDRETFFKKISRKINLANSNFIKNAGAGKKECEANQGDGLATCCAIAEIKIPLLNVRKKVIDEMSFFINDIILPIFTSLNFESKFLSAVSKFGDKSEADRIFSFLCENKNVQVNEKSLVANMMRFVDSEESIKTSFEIMKVEITKYLQNKVDKYSWAIDKTCRNAVAFNDKNILSIVHAVFELSSELSDSKLSDESRERKEELRQITKKIKQDDVFSDALGPHSFGVL